MLASPILDRYGQRIARPMMPAAVADAIQTFFRRSGRDATTDEWHPLLKCFVVRVSRRETDPVMRLVQSGSRSKQQVMESILLNEPVPGARMQYKPLELEQMGASGITKWLEERDMWSGRGMYKTPFDAIHENDRNTERRQQQADDEADERAVEILRRRMRANGLAAPRVSVGVDLRQRVK